MARNLMHRCLNGVLPTWGTPPYLVWPIYIMIITALVGEAKSGTSDLIFKVKGVLSSCRGVNYHGHTKNFHRVDKEGQGDGPQ